MSPPKKAQAAFISAITLLLLSGLAAYFAITHAVESQAWVIHTYEVRTTLGEIDSAVLRAGRARSGYVIFGTDDYLLQFKSAVPEIFRQVKHLRDLTKDNLAQQELCARLEDATARRVDLLDQSVQPGEHTPQSASQQAEFERKILPLNSETTAIVLQMRDREQQLLEVRQKAANRLFAATIGILLVAFILAIILFSVQNRFLSTELAARMQAEQNSRNSEESLRRLTGRLLQLQDAERRKFSRELHDSLGQALVGAKMNLESFAIQPRDGLLAEVLHLLDQSITETRTISHLLHPPLLDEAGLASATKWYVEGFAQRSGIEVKVDLADHIDRLPKPVALGLFRMLQESLTNIHRHSGSAKAEVALQLLPSRVVLTVRDYGKGVEADWLDTFRTNGMNAGVGLAGMRERIRELGGNLSISRCSPGTLIAVSLPVPKDVTNSPQSSAAD